MKVEGASSSEEALPHLTTHSYDFVLCDFNLPGLNGEQFFQRMQANGPSGAAPKFVFMSGALLDPGTMAIFSEKGAAVLQKPFHIAGLAALLTELLEAQTKQGDLTASAIWIAWRASRNLDPHQNPRSRDW